MNTKELIEYLQGFEADAEISFLVVNPPGRLHHEVAGAFYFVSEDRPVIGIEVGDGIPFNEEEKKAAEADENDI